MGPQEATNEMDKHSMQRAKAQYTSPIHCLVAGEGRNSLKVLAVLQIMELFLNAE